MKKLKLIVALSALVIIMKSQPYGQILYSYSGAFLSSGNVTSINSAGFLMGGYIPSTSGGSPSFYINKVSSGGATTGAGSFSNDYQIFYNSSCSAGSQNQLLDCFGVSAIEIFVNSPTQWYAVAGTVDNPDPGVFFTTLDNTGTPVIQNLYQLPAGCSAITKPLLVEYSGDYYITGSFFSSTTTKMYIIQVLANGNLGWDVVYDFGTAGTKIIPRDIVVSPYNSNELAIVGMINDPTYSDEGFFMTKATTGGGAPTIFTTYGQGSGSGVDQFYSMCVATSPNPGYVIGGYSDINTGTGTHWILKVDQNGTIIWNHVYGNLTDNTTAIISITERFSSTYNQNTYYGVATSTLGILTFKLDKNGLAFSQTLNPNNRFVYDAGASNKSVPNSVSYINAVGGPDEGIQIYGTDDGVNGGNFYFIEAYFNGESGCGPTYQTLTTLGSTVSAPSTTNSSPPGNGTYFSSCANFSIFPNSSPVSTTQVCGGNNSYTTGINSKSQATEIKELNIAGTEIQIYPNPVTNKLTLISTNDLTDEIKIQLFNLAGQHIKTIFDDNKLNNFEVDLNTLDIPSGSYLLNVSINGNSSNHKLVYIKE